MFILKIADLNIKVNNKYSFLEKQCASYIVSDTDYDFEVTVYEEDLKSEQEKTTETFSIGYIESICCYRKIAFELLNYEALLMHGAVVSVNNEGYAFTAKSGTGKTTHIRLWKKLLNDKMIYVNGDKPIIRLKNDIPYAYGTPWCGKENYENNISVPLKAICVVKRNINNSIKSISGLQIITPLLNQILIPIESEAISKTFNILDKILKYTKAYELECNMDIEAAVISYNAMSK